MKHRFSFVTLLSFLLITFSLSSCQLAGDIFKGGMWVGAIAVIFVVGLIIYLVTRVGKK